MGKKNFTKLILFGITLFVPGIFCQNCKEKRVSQIKMNEVQVIGSHNSYKKEIQPELLEFLRKENKETALALDYQHVSIPQQLDFGLRNLELDIVNDPRGGRYAHPLGNQLLTAHGIEPWTYDSPGTMEKPGFKVMHVPDLDFRSWCPLLTDGLKQIKSWSDAHPGHLPVIITMNAKTDGIPREGFTPLLPFTKASFDSLDQEISSVFPKNRIIEPDDIRGNYRSLNEAVRANNWPSLESTRGKFLFVLDEQGEKQEIYLQGHPSLQGRVMFVNANPGTDASAFVILNDPVTYQDSISSLVKKGYIVRTRADADTREARMNDYERFNAAMASGAQIISTDYYLPDKRLDNNYHIKLPGDVMSHYNPVLLPDSIPAKSLTKSWF